MSDPSVICDLAAIHCCLIPAPLSNAEYSILNSFT